MINKPLGSPRAALVCRKKSFTLLEILGAMTIFVVAVLPIFYSFTKGVKTHQNNMNKLETSLLLKNIIREVQLGSIGFSGTESVTIDSSPLAYGSKKWWVAADSETDPLGTRDLYGHENIRYIVVMGDNDSAGLNLRAVQAWVYWGVNRTNGNRANKSGTSSFRYFYKPDEFTGREELAPNYGPNVTFRFSVYTP